MARTVETNCPFTLEEYRSLLRLAKDRFPLADYTDYTRLDSFVIWRHDVEYSIFEMSVLAELDAEEGVASTFFVQLHCDLYNFWDPGSVRQIKQWVAWGHQLGLHFDCGFHGERVFDEIDSLVLKEKSLLEDVFETPVASFAYHNPDSASRSHRSNYGGLVNAYNDDFSSGAITYVSDSNGRWRDVTIRDVLEDSATTKAQVNTHDTWWTDRRIPQIEKLEAAVLRDAQRRIDDYKSNANVVVDHII